MIQTLASHAQFVSKLYHGMALASVSQKMFTDSYVYTSCYFPNPTLQSVSNF